MTTSPPATGPLAGRRAVVAGASRAALTLGALLADYGADVVLLEPPEGLAARRRLLVDGTSMFWGPLTRNCRSVVADIGTDAGRQQALAVAAAADVVIDDHGSPCAVVWGADLAAVRAANPHAVTITVSPFGATGPLADMPGSEIVAEALAGLAHITGAPDKPPLHSDYPVGAAVTALFGAVSAVAVLRSRDRGAGGAHIDLATTDVVLRILDFLPLYYDQLGWISERQDSTSDYQFPVGRWCTSDGVWMSFTGNTEDVVHRFFRGMGRPELADDERFTTNVARVEHRDALDALIRSYFASHTLADVDADMEQAGVPIAAILSMAEVVDNEQYRVRGAIATIDDDGRELRLPNVAVRFSSTPGAVRTVGPALGADTAAVTAGWTGPVADGATDRAAASAHGPARSGGSAAAGPAAAGAASPLAGLRVLDLGNVIAGPLAATLLGDLGADVVKVERPEGGDLFRKQAPLVEGKSIWWEVVGRGKRSIALDFKDAADLDVLRDLVRHADVLVANFVPGVAEKLGIDAASLAAVNPKLVYVSISGYGQHGPYASRRAFGRNAEAFSGMASLTGYPGDLPQHTGFPVADSFSALFGAFAALAALDHRDRESGTGQFVDVALFESVFRFMEPQVALYGSGDLWLRGRAAGEPDMWRSMVRGADGWLSVSASSRDELERVAAWLGRSADELLGQPSLEHPDSSTVAVAALATAAASAGIAAAPSLTIDALVQHPQIVERGLLVRAGTAAGGSVLMPAVAPVIDGVRAPVSRPAPLLGAHRAEILADWTATTEVTDVH